MIYVYYLAQTFETNFLTNVQEIYTLQRGYQCYFCEEKVKLKEKIPEYDNAGGIHEESSTSKRRFILAIFDCHIRSRGKAFASEAKGSDNEVIKEDLSSCPSCR